jgi:hypothetical protein
MRLQILESGFSPIQKLFIGVVRLTGGTVPGPIAAMSYRRALWGKQASACFQQAMRGMHEWKVAETELFAAFVSKKNACEY